MKLLFVKVTGLPLFKGEMEMTFFARQRVDDADKDVLLPMNPGSRYYLNSTNAIVGINASGKTSVLKVVLLVLDIINNKPINHCETKDILGDGTNTFIKAIFLSDIGELCQLETHISATYKSGTRSYEITQESLRVKPLSSVKTKKMLADFTGIAPVAVRDQSEVFLPDDVSIVIAYNKNNGQQTYTASLLSMTDMNVLPISDEIPEAVIQFLDPTVEKLFFEREGLTVTIHLKFRNRKEIVLSDPAELNAYLSSGTIKGIVTFTLAIRTLHFGGYMIVDELEDHFNREIAATLMRLFMDSSVNIKGGVLIFSTHYPELLDEFTRNDSIFITRNDDGICIVNLNDVLSRNDIKKSDVYQSGILEGTVPAYDAYMRLKKNIRLSLEKGE